MLRYHQYFFLQEESCVDFNDVVNLHAFKEYLYLLSVNDRWILVRRSEEWYSFTSNFMLNK